MLVSSDGICVEGFCIYQKNYIFSEPDHSYSGVREIWLSASMFLPSHMMFFSIDAMWEHSLTLWHLYHLIFFFFYLTTHSLRLLFLLSPQEC